MTVEASLRPGSTGTSNPKGILPPSYSFLPDSGTSVSQSRWVTNSQSTTDAPISSSSINRSSHTTDPRSTSHRVHHPSGLHAITIVSLVIGSIIVVAALVICRFYLLRRRRNYFRKRDILAVNPTPTGIKPAPHHQEIRCLDDMKNL